MRQTGYLVHSTFLFDQSNRCLDWLLFCAYCPSTTLLAKNHWGIYHDSWLHHCTSHCSTDRGCQVRLLELTQQLMRIEYPNVSFKRWRRWIGCVSFHQITPMAATKLPRGVQNRYVAFCFGPAPISKAECRIKDFQWLVRNAGRASPRPKAAGRLLFGAWISRHHGVEIA